MTWGRWSIQRDSKIHNPHADGYGLIVSYRENSEVEYRIYSMIHWSRIMKYPWVLYRSIRHLKKHRDSHLKKWHPEMTLKVTPCVY